MYAMMLSIHSGMRWIVLVCLIFSVFSAFIGYTKGIPYKKSDSLARTLTVIFVHLQLVFGLGLYFMSPLVKTILHSEAGANPYNDNSVFFAFIHPIAMLCGIISITVGSALTRRSDDDKQKFKLTLITFGIALLIALIMIPWSIYPIISRPLFR